MADGEQVGGHDSGELPTIGWREWVALPELGVAHVKSKIDTGARTSAIHAEDIEIFEGDGDSEGREGGGKRVRFTVAPFQRDAATVVEAEAVLLDQRRVKSSGGHTTFRPVVQVELAWAGRTWPIELTLVSRDRMGFRMLLGREAVRGRCIVDPSRSYLGGVPAEVRRRKKKKTGRAAKRG